MPRLAGAKGPVSSQYGKVMAAHSSFPPDECIPQEVPASGIRPPSEDKWSQYSTGQTLKEQNTGVCVPGGRDCWVYLFWEHSLSCPIDLELLFLYDTELLIFISECPSESSTELSLLQNKYMKKWMRPLLVHQGIDDSLGRAFSQPCQLGALWVFLVRTLEWSKSSVYSGSWAESSALPSWEEALPLFWDLVPRWACLSSGISSQTSYVFW